MTHVHTTHRLSARTVAIVAALLALVATMLFAPVPNARADMNNPADYGLIVNKKRPLNPQNYYPGDLTNFGGGAMRAEVAGQLGAMFNQAAAEGINLTVVSGFRSYETQVSVYNNYVNLYGQAYADTISARPGYSEHQTGMTVDVGAASGACGLGECFANTPEGQWVAQNSQNFGFIIRYPQGMTGVTGYAFEPWHLRYLGSYIGAFQASGAPTLEQFYGVEGGDYGPPSNGGGTENPPPPNPENPGPEGPEGPQEPAEPPAEEPAEEAPAVIELRPTFWILGGDSGISCQAEITPEGAVICPAPEAPAP